MARRDDPNSPSALIIGGAGLVIAGFSGWRTGFIPWSNKGVDAAQSPLAFKLLMPAMILVGLLVLFIGVRDLMKPPRRPSDDMRPPPVKRRR